MRRPTTFSASHAASSAVSVVGHAEQHEQAALDLADGLPVDHHAGARTR